MKTIKLFMDFEFTSLSPDAQPISLGIVSGKMLKPKIQEMFDKKQTPSLGFNEDEYLEFKSFYAEFSDFDMNRCDDWVKENVVSKLYLKDKFGESARHTNGNLWECTGITKGLMFHLKEWLEQFSDYQIQFVCDCGTYDWYWMVQLLAEWEETENRGERKSCPGCSFFYSKDESFKTGLPKLPTNISPVAEDLNDLIARVKGISVREAFDLNREEMAHGGFLLVPETAIPDGMDLEEFVKEWKKAGKAILRESDCEVKQVVIGEHLKHNALWDAKVIKETYQKLK